jgi:IclR family pca regulon transcriptional regulator
MTTQMSSQPTESLVGRASAVGKAAVDERLFVASVEKAMRVLEIFGKNATELSMADITARTGLGRSATQRFVYTLCQLGYLRRSASAPLYALSTKLVGLVGGLLGSNARLQAAYPILMDLAKETRETVSWLELDGDDIVVLGNIPSAHLTSVNLPVGSRFAALAASSGQVLLLEASEPQLREMIGRLAPPVRARFGDYDDQDILALFEKVRGDGYSMTEKNLDQGSVSLSVPIRDHAGRIVAALNLSTLTVRYSTEAARQDLLPLLMAAAQAISVR